MARPKAKGGDLPPAGNVENSSDSVNHGDKAGENEGANMGTAEGEVDVIVDEDPLGVGLATEVGPHDESRVHAIDGEVEPTDDHIARFERRLDRLVAIVEEAEFSSGTLVGDIRDALLEQYKARPKPWSELSHGEQQDLARRLEIVAKDVLRKVVVVVAEQDEISVHARLDGYTAKGDAFKLTLKATIDEETAIQLFRLDGHEVVLISADSTRFRGERGSVKLDPDQPGLTFADGEAKTPDHPDDDSDLAGEEDDGQDEDDASEVNDEVGDPSIPLAGPGGDGERVNLKTSMIERLDVSRDAWEDVREATPAELAAERDRIADFDVAAEA